jgi:hypothetical protein
MILEMLMVSQLLGDMVLASQHLSNLNIENITNDSCLYSDDKEIVGLLLILEPVLLGMSEFETPMKTLPMPNWGLGLNLPQAIRIIIFSILSLKCCRISPIVLTPCDSHWTCTL